MFSHLYFFVGIFMGVAMKTRIRTLQKALPYYYFLVLFLTFAILVSSFCVYFLKNMRAIEYANLKNISKSVTTSLEQEITSISAVSMNIIYSNSIHSGIAYLAETNHSFQEIYARKQEIFNNMFDFIGLQPDISQVNIYPKNEKAVGTGFYTFQKDMKLSARPWYEDAVKKNGSRYMTAPAPLSHYMFPSPFSVDMDYIAFVRLYYDNAHQIEGAVEVLQSCSHFFSNIDETILINKNISISIIDNEGQMVYPFNAPDNSDPICFWQNFAQNSLSSGMVYLMEDNNGKKNAVIQATIPSVGWNIYISEPDSVISGTLAKSVLFFIFILILILILTLGICFMISNRILFPLHQLQETFESIHLDNFMSSNDSPKLPDSHYAEINALIDAFDHMYAKLNHSTTLMLQSREEEIKAKEIATQSLMKPHFLYNNLATIGIMAEENMNREIITLTENLSDCLRYTSTASASYVSIKDEFFYTQKYLLCMEARYKDRLFYSFSFGHTKQGIIVPKLIVQPLVENALKYAFYKTPPWILSISSYQDESHWYISVQDNGVGFSDEMKKEVFPLWKK